MRKILFAAAGLALAGASLTLTAPAQAATANLPWCAEPRDMGFSQVCDFYTFEQCRAYVSGIGGTCAQNFQTQRCAAAFSRAGASHAAHRARRARSSIIKRTRIRNRH